MTTSNQAPNNNGSPATNRTAVDSAQWEDITKLPLGTFENVEIRRPLSEAELSWLLEFVRHGSVAEAGSASRVLGQCSKVACAQRLPSVIARFKCELDSRFGNQQLSGTYLSPRVFYLNQFLVAFANFGLDAVPLLQAEQRRDAGALDRDKWWVLALGMAGDSTVAYELKQMAQSEPDKYTRCVAVRAYARSAKADAIPVLAKLLDDPAVSDYKGCVGDPVRLISTTASDELARLKTNAGVCF